MKPLLWMRAIRDEGGAPSTSTIAVLGQLALRMRPDGGGFASQQQLADDASVTTRTVQRALKWARDTGYLVQTRRGHRLDNERAVASEYRLTTPGQRDRGVTLERPQRTLKEETQGDKRGPQRDISASQRDTGVHPRGLLQEVLPPNPTHWAAAEAQVWPARVDVGGGSRCADNPNPERHNTVLDLLAGALDDELSKQLRDSPLAGDVSRVYGPLLDAVGPDKFPAAALGNLAGARDVAKVLLCQERKAAVGNMVRKAHAQTERRARKRVERALNPPDGLVLNPVLDRYDTPDEAASSVRHELERLDELGLIGSAEDLAAQWRICQAAAGQPGQPGQPGHASGPVNGARTA